MKRILSLLLILILIAVPAYADYELIVTDNINVEDLELRYIPDKRISVDNILNALDEVNFQFSEDYKIYVTNYILDRGSVTGVAYNNNEIILFISHSAWRKNINKDYLDTLYQETIVHELGHLVYYSMTDKQRFEYFELREIPEDWGDSIRTRYTNRPSEIFAEDFRILFGGEKAREKYHMNRRLKPPNEVKGLKEFIEKLQ